jgi:hypothetical protein
MLLPCALLDSLLFLSALGLSIATLLLSMLLPALVLLLLLDMLLLLVLVLLLLLGMLLLPVLVLLLLNVLLLFVLVLLLLLSALWLLSMLLFGLRLLVLALLLFGMILLFALLPLLCVGRGDSEKQRQDDCTGDSNYFHMGCLYYCSLLTLALARASYRCIDWAADGFAGYEKFYSPVLLPAGGVIVGGHGQSVAETLCADRIYRHALLH